MAEAEPKGEAVAKGRRLAKTAAKSARSPRAVARDTKPPDESLRANAGRAQIPAERVIGDIRIKAGSAFSATTRLRVAGMKTAHEKEKLSITLDKSIVEEIRALSKGRPMSTSINALLHDALAQYHLGELVAEMEEEAGPVTAKAYDRVFSQWFEEE